jgi:AbrB family looped-hinge helix DNA binding protein
MSPALQVKVKRHGRITLPKELREANNIEDGDLILLAEAGDGLKIMQHKKSNVDRIADGISREFRKEGITLKDIRKELKKIRK